MPHTKKNKGKALSPQMDNSKDQRAPSLLRRLSSSFFSLIPSFNAGRTIPNRDLTQRPMTAPYPQHTAVQRQQRAARPISPSERRGTLPAMIFPTLSDPKQPCPYDASTYHSFPSIEEPSCSMCGLRHSASRASDFLAKNQPCSECRSKTSFSHLAHRAERVRSAMKRSMAQRATVVSQSRSPPSPLLAPRIVPASVAAKRIGSPPRKASLPPDLVPIWQRQKRPTTSVSPPPLTARDVRQVISVIDDDSRPISPKLHHIHLLPYASDYPYVHKNEVEQHLAALRAGIPSPLQAVWDKPRAASVPGIADYTETVYYGPPIISPTSTTTSPQYQNPQPVKDDSSASSISTSSTPRVGGRRLELRGGCGRPGNIPRLRGGSEEEQAQCPRSFWFKAKSWLLTCSRRSYHDETNSDNDLPPPRIVDPARVAHVKNHSCRRVPVPQSVLRGSCVNLERRSSTQASQMGTPAAAVSSTSSLHTPVILTCTPPVSYLRGGAGAPRPLLDTDRLPPTLYFLAGGKRRPVTVSSWRKERPKKRIGGFLGLVLHGRYAGLEYGQGRRSVNGCESEVRVEMAAEKVTAGSEVSVGVAAEVRAAADNGVAASNEVNAAPQETPAPAVAT